MQILFILYERITSNSGIQVHSIANQLSMKGMNCLVGVPGPPYMIPWTDNQLYEVVDCWKDIGRIREFITANPSAQITHAWTPREFVRKYLEYLKRVAKLNFVIHLEDNEENLLLRIINNPFVLKIRVNVIGIPDNLSHPIRYKGFLNSARGCTVVVNKLTEFVPDGTPWMRLRPGVDSKIFSNRFDRKGSRAKFGLKTSDFVLVYTGNVHKANVHEVREVYRGVKRLREEGLPAYLLRTGTDYVSPYSRDLEGIVEYVINLGYIPYDRMPEVLACGDLLIQPGKPDAFNNYRFPSKLPEYMAMGKPVILPRTNLGLHLRDMQEAIVRDEVDAIAIAEAAKMVVSDNSLRNRLGKGARAFAERELNWHDRAVELIEFYGTILSQ